jgi:hypothetical protein
MLKTKNLPLDLLAVAHQGVNGKARAKDGTTTADGRNHVHNAVTGA